MITSAKKLYQKNQMDRTLGQMVKAKLYRQNHKKVHRLNFWMIPCLFRYYRDAGYINQVDCGDLICCS